MKQRICVFCSSSNGVDDRYFRIAELLGRQIAGRNHSLIYGGGAVGLMGTLARSVKSNGGTVVGVIPEALNLPGIVYDDADQLIVTGGMRERKAAMDEQADAFIGLPGGFGTLEEILEIITLKQLQYHNKPIVLVNTDNFFDDLLNFFERLYHEQFAKSIHRHLYHVVPDPASALDHIESYRPKTFPRKWA